MLTNIRGAAESWLGKIVLTIMFGFLIISFAIWGIGDIFRNGFGSNTLATVGKTEIGVESFRRAFQQRVQEIQQRSRGFSAEQARTIGLDRQVLSQIISETALNETSRTLGLAMADEDIARSLAANPAFRGADGRFNRLAFDGYLRNEGLSESSFIQQQRQATLRQHLGEAVSGGFSTPQVMTEMLHRYRSEERDIASVIVPGISAAGLTAPDEATLKALHDQRKGAFRAPEIRKATALVLSPTGFAADITISDSDLQAAYARGLASNRFGEAEKRQIQQIVFPNPAEAQAAADKLKGGMSFEALLEERKLKAADVDLGLKARAELLDKAIAEAAFALADQAVSAPVQGTFGSVLLRVTGITPGSALPFESVRETLRSDVSAAKLTGDPAIRRKIDATHDRIEELRAAGKSLEQVADELKRPLITLETDAQGQSKTGEPVAALLPDAGDVVKAIYQSDRGVDNEAIRTRDNGYVWFEITSIEKARERNFDEVRPQVEETWRNDEASRRTSENAAAFLKRLEAGESLETIASELGGSVETAAGVTRNGNAQVGPSAAASAFALKEGAYAIASTGKGADRMLLKVTAISTPAYKAEDAAIKSLKTQLDRTLADELLSQYVGVVQNTLGVTVNERILGQATGATQNPQR